MAALLGRYRAEALNQCAAALHPSAAAAPPPLAAAAASSGGGSFPALSAAAGGGDVLATARGCGARGGGDELPRAARAAAAPHVDVGPALLAKFDATLRRDAHGICMNYLLTS